MSNSKVVINPESAPEVPPDSFEWTLEDGSVVIVGLPKPTIRLKLRDILTPELLSDNEIATIAKALLCIKTINGKAPIMRTFNEFEFMLNRFGTDEQLDGFMAEYQRLVNPAVTGLVQSAIDEAMEKKLKPGEMQDLIQLRLMEHEAANRDKVKYSSKTRSGAHKPE